QKTDKTIRSLFNDRGNDARTDGAATFADSEAQLLFHRDRNDQLDLDRDVVARHHHFGAFRQLYDARHVRRAEIELRTIVGEERRMTAAFFLRQHVDLRLEGRVRRHRTRLRENLTALDAFAFDTAQEATDVVASLALIEQLAEHFHAGDGRRGGRLDA